jgi:hypothetical protein
MNKLCEHKDCELLKSQNKIEKFIEHMMESSLKLLQYKYPNHNKDCLQRIFAERIKVEHHSLLGELIHRNIIQRKVVERNEVAND